MDGAIWAMAGGIIVAFLNFVVSPMLQSRLSRAKENDPVLGWKTAVEEVRLQARELTVRVSALENENLELERKVALLKSQVDEQSGVIRRQERIMRDQNRIIEALRNYVSFLKDAWRNIRNGEEAPPPSPAYAYWINHDPTGGIQS